MKKNILLLLFILFKVFTFAQVNEIEIITEKDVQNFIQNIMQINDEMQKKKLLTFDENLFIENDETDAILRKFGIEGSNPCEKTKIITYCFLYQSIIDNIGILDNKNLKVLENKINQQALSIINNYMEEYYSIYGK
ncbi:hypothetical protein SAMN04487977_106105 [Treponema bryantii]|uniref:Uncharacterized protein n=1 Tax=Treponema bryantii TaxID=163 RepID=A0A1H9HA23_9SPIR|nr:hypothetical protein [Treponema bryantii]SEQ59088.1 hypothetical protein SAMN04487977_106105 [Treponema bryantii]